MSRLVGHWFALGSVMVFGTVAAGGITRLTESGLSITEWNLVKGIKWPKDLEHEFELYKKSPEYKICNSGMSIDDFKRIFFFEWMHRNLGRAVGLYYVLPTMFIRSPSAILSSSLVCFQGFLGWNMVQSGLDPSLQHPRVSQHYLALHLTTAFALYLISLNSALSILYPQKRISVGKFKAAAHATAGLALLTAISGSFVAGLDAGLVYNEWPKMGKGFLPDELDFKIFDNPVSVQFNHRLMAYSTCSSTLGLCFWARKFPIFRPALLVGAAVLTQASLGILTLVYLVPIPLAALHQAGSLGVLSCCLWLLRKLKK